MTALAKLFSTTTFRLALAYLLAYSLAAAVVVGTIFWKTNDMLTGQVLQTITAEVRGLREQFEVGGPTLLARTLLERSRTPGNSLYFLADARGRKIAGNLDRVPPELLSGDAQSGRGAAGGLFRYRRRAPTGPETRLAVGVPIRVPGGALLIVGRDVEDQRDFANVVRRIFLWGFGFVALVGLAGGIWVSRSILKRIDAMTRASQRIMAGNLSERIPLESSSDELGRLSQSLNAMLERIEQLMNGLREVSDNIAHDLKTPLGRLRNRVEAALRDGETLAHAPCREVLERTIEEADELIRTFNALLSIARLEAGAGASAREPVHLAGLLADVAELYGPLAEEQGLALEVEADEEVQVIGDRQLLGQALANLVDNAIKYGAGRQAQGRGDGEGDGDGEGGGEGGDQGAQRGRIVLRARREGAQAAIGVADEGPGIPEAERERVLKRFVRLEASRSAPGSGLGLALVAAVARLHGGTVRLGDNAPGGGLEAMIVLPAASAHNGVGDDGGAMGEA